MISEGFFIESRGIRSYRSAASLARFGQYLDRPVSKGEAIRPCDKDSHKELSFEMLRHKDFSDERSIFDLGAAGCGTRIIA